MVYSRKGFSPARDRERIAQVFRNDWLMMQVLAGNMWVIDLRKERDATLSVSVFRV